MLGGSYAVDGIVYESVKGEIQRVKWTYSATRSFSSLVCRNVPLGGVGDASHSVASALVCTKKFYKV